MNRTLELLRSEQERAKLEGEAKKLILEAHGNACQKAFKPFHDMLMEVAEVRIDRKRDIHPRKMQAEYGFITGCQVRFGNGANVGPIFFCRWNDGVEYAHVTGDKPAEIISYEEMSSRLLRHLASLLPPKEEQTHLNAEGESSEGNENDSD